MPKRDAGRERRIMEEIVVDAYGAEERAMSNAEYRRLVKEARSRR